MNNVFSKDSSAVPEYGLRLHTAVLWLRLLGFTARELSDLGNRDITRSCGSAA